MSTLAETESAFGTFSDISSTGVSNLSACFRRLLDNEDASSATFWKDRCEVKEDLQSVKVECNEQGWDGYGAVPIKLAALIEAGQFIDALPSWVPSPEIIPEPSGEVGLQWDYGKNRTFLVSLNGNKKMVYAGLFGKFSKVHGTEIFESALPSIVIDSLGKIIQEAR